MSRRVNPISSLSLNAAVDDGVVLFGATDLPAGDAPEWVHLLPAGPAIKTRDGRGPYTLDDPAKVVAASQALAGERGAPIDENHATDLAAPNGHPAPARGWLTDFQVRADGIWGKVDWNGPGKQLMAEHAYRGISPVIQLDKNNRVLAIARASLINKPNIVGLTALHQEQDMNLLQKLIAALKLKEGTSEDTLITAVTALHAQSAQSSEALQGIAKAAGLADGAKAEEIVGAVTRLKTEKPAAGDAKTIEALQAELATVTTQLNGVLASGKREKAERFVDGAVREMRVGVSAARDRWITMHMADPTGTEEMIGKLPKMPAGSIMPKGEPDGATESLNAEESEVAKQMGIDPAVFAASRDGKPLPKKSA